MLCHLLTKLELTASASMAQRLTDDCVCQWVNLSSSVLVLIFQLPSFFLVGPNILLNIFLSNTESFWIIFSLRTLPPILVF